MKKLKKPSRGTPSSGIRSAAGACPNCKGDRFVCENHPRLAWPSECDCGAGDPCPVCNVAEPPAMPEAFVRDENADAALHEALQRFAEKTKKPPKH